MLGIEQTIRSQMGGLEAWVISQGIDALVETRIVLTRFIESKCHVARLCFRERCLRCFS